MQHRATYLKLVARFVFYNEVLHLLRSALLVNLGAKFR